MVFASSSAPAGVRCVSSQSRVLSTSCIRGKACECVPVEPHLRLRRVRDRDPSNRAPVLLRSSTRHGTRPAMRQIHMRLGLTSPSWPHSTRCLAGATMTRHLRLQVQRSPGQKTADVARLRWCHARRRVAGEPRARRVGGSTRGQRGRSSTARPLDPPGGVAARASGSWRGDGRDARRPRAVGGQRWRGTGR